MSLFPFGQQARRRPRPPLTSEARLLVLGVCPDALHIRWTPPDGVAPIGALAVEEEPAPFWDGSDAPDRVEQWRETVGWRDEWGWAANAGSNGGLGRRVAENVLRPLDASAGQVHFTYCLASYHVRQGRNSQHEIITTRYNPFAVDRPRLDIAELPLLPHHDVLVSRAVEQEGDALLAEIAESGAARVVTLGQEAADVLARLCGADGVRLLPDESYGVRRDLSVHGRPVEWLPLTHPGHSNPKWRRCHDRWALTA